MSSSQTGRRRMTEPSNPDFSSDLISWVDPVEAERNRKIESVKKLLSRRKLSDGDVTSTSNSGNKPGNSSAFCANNGSGNSNCSSPSVQLRPAAPGLKLPEMLRHASVPQIRVRRGDWRYGSENLLPPHRPALLRSSRSVSLAEGRDKTSLYADDIRRTSEFLEDFDPFSSRKTANTRVDDGRTSCSAPASSGDHDSKRSRPNPSQTRLRRSPTFRAVKKLLPLQDGGSHSSFPVFDLKPLKVVDFTPYWLASIRRLAEDVGRTTSADHFHGLVISRRLKGLKVALSSIKILVYVDEMPGRPLKFTCDPSSSVEQIVMFVLCSSSSESKTLPLDQYTLKVHYYDEYLLPKSSLSDYAYLHDCVKFGRDAEFKLARIPMPPKRDSTNEDGPFVCRSFVRENLEVVLETIYKESEKLFETMTQRGRLRCDACVQSVKALCALMDRIETIELNWVIKSLIAFCNEIDPLITDMDETSIQAALKHLKRALSDVLTVVHRITRTFCETSAVGVTVERLENMPRTATTVVRAIDAVDEPFAFKLETLHNFPCGWPTTYHQFYFSCAIMYGEETMCDVVRSGTGQLESGFNQYMLFSSRIEFQLPKCVLPRESYLLMKLYGLKLETGGSNDESSSASVTAAAECTTHDDLLAWSVLPLFDDQNYLIEDLQFVSLSTVNLTQPTPIRYHVLDAGSQNPTLVISVPSFGRVRFPDMLTAEDVVACDFDQLDAGSRLLLEDIIENRGVGILDSDEKDLMWEKRLYLCKHSAALPLVLSSSIGWNWACLPNIYSLLKLWTPLSCSEALELLLPSFPDFSVRNTAVSYIKQREDYPIQFLLPQLVEALRFEALDRSELLRHLMQCSVADYGFAMMFLWILEQKKDEGGCFSVICDAVMASLLNLSGESLRNAFFAQQSLISKLDMVSTTLKEGIRDFNAKTLFLSEQLNALDGELLQHQVRVPFRPGLLLAGVDARKSKFYHSLNQPLRICFQSIRFSLDLIFKTGDDLRQDTMVLQLMRLMDYLWMRDGLDLRMAIFSTLSTGNKKGLIEVMKDSKTLREIQLEEGGVAGVLRDDLIKRWLQKQNSSQLEYEIALRNFRGSCAGWCVGTYILGVCDRHNDNILLTPRGHLFHIDFGKFLGDAQMFGSFKRDRVPFLLTSDMFYAINAGATDKTPFFQEFVDLCCQAFNIVRKHSVLFMNLIKLMTCSGIAGLNDDAVSFIHRNLWLECTDSEAAGRFTRMIEECLRSKFPKLNFLVHTVAQGQLKTSFVADSTQLLSFVPQVYTNRTDGKIMSAHVLGCEKWRMPEKLYVYKLEVERLKEKVPSYVYRSYDEFMEFYEMMFLKFPLNKLYSLPKGYRIRNNISDVAVRRQSEIAAFLSSIFAMSEEISQCDLVYTFFHPLYRDEQAAIHSNRPSILNALNESTPAVKVSGELKLTIIYRQGVLELFISHARNLMLINGQTLPDSYVKTYLKPDQRHWSKKKTRIVHGTQNPTFNERFIYRQLVSQLKTKVLEVTVWHHDMLKENTFLGGVVIPLTFICTVCNEISQWYHLEDIRAGQALTNL